MVRHAISVDIEDWYQSTYDSHAPISERFEANTDRILEAFARVGVRGTFFVLGLAAEKAPAVVRAIAQGGHEVQSHGYGHREVFTLTEEQFRQDLLRAKGVLEGLIGRAVWGFRAPSFSIDERTPWAFDVLAETGHRYDSSIFPIKMSRYGIDGYPPECRIVTTDAGRRLVEAPIATFEAMGRQWPVGGGGYFRLLPYWVIRRAFRQLDARERSGVIYFHPYEYDPEEIEAYTDKLTLKQRLHQGLGRKGFPVKVDRLLRDFQFTSLGELLHPLLAQL